MTRPGLYLCVRSFELSGRRSFSAGQAYSLSQEEISTLEGLKTPKNPKGAMAFFEQAEGGRRAAPPPAGDADPPQDPPVPPPAGDADPPVRPPKVPRKQGAGTAEL